MSEASATEEARGARIGAGPSARAAAPAPPSPAVPLSHGLSLKLLLLTIIFALLAGMLIFFPSIASYRMNWLQERLGTAAAVGLVLVEGDPAALPRQAQDDVLSVIGAKAIAVRDAESSRLLVATEVPPSVDEHIDLANMSPFQAMADALDTLVDGGDRMLRVFGPVGDSPEQFELVLPDSGLREAMLVFSRNLALLSAVISVVTAFLVYLAIDRVMIRPIRTMTRSMLDFAEHPDDPARVVSPVPRSDEIGVAMRELGAMQERVRRLLGERRHLAELGLAVSKINHDMRNILASAQLISDRLQSVDDPTVQAFAPKLLRALDRAVGYTEGVLAYGRTEEAPPARRPLALAPLVDEVFSTLALDPAAGTTRFRNEVSPGFHLRADPEQLFRILTNLCRNAVQAMAGGEGEAVLSVQAERVRAGARILVSDSGPGLPPAARENLFSPFRGSARQGGTGLGLAIAEELARAHGGTLALVESVPGRTVFAVSLPDAPL